MTVAVIVHVESDRPYVDSLQGELEGVRMIACAVAPRTPIMAFDPRLPLVLVWSPAAIEIGAAATYSALAAAHRGEIILCVVDRAPCPRPFERLRCAIVDGSPNSSFFPGGLSAALIEAHRRRLFTEAAGARDGAVRADATQRALAAGIARGLAGSVAVFGVGGAAAMAVDHLPAGFDPGGAPPMPVDVAYLDTVADMAEEAPLAPGVWADAELIVVDPAQADVPLANPSIERVAARRAAAFVTDVPLQIWSPEDELDATFAELTELAPIELPSESVQASITPAYDGATLVSQAALDQTAEALPAI